MCIAFSHNIFHHKSPKNITELRKLYALIIVKRNLFFHSYKTQYYNYSEQFELPWTRS
ncbi:hypothetical protein Hanom_Chr11g01006771 [Helianthus anomalus]